MRHFRFMAMLAFFALACFSFAWAQEEKAAPAQGTGEEHHHAITAHHKNAQEHAKALHHHAATKTEMDKTVAKEHTEEMGKSISGAKTHHEAVKQHMTETEKTAAQPHSEAMAMHHDKAAAHHKALTEEMAKDKPDTAKVQEHTAAIHHHMKQAETEHKKMMKKRGVTDAKTPPTPPPD